MRSALSRIRAHPSREVPVVSGTFQDTAMLMFTYTNPNYQENVTF